MEWSEISSQFEWYQWIWKSNSERIDKKLEEKSEVLNWDGLKFPVNLIDISKFEKHNSSISVNVFGYEKLVYTHRISKHYYKRERTVNLLLISGDTKQHYGWIKAISKLLSLQNQKMVMVDMCVLDVLILSKPRNH